MPADKRAARMTAMANIHLAQVKAQAQQRATKVKTAGTVAALLADLAAANATSAGSVDAAAMKERAKVLAADQQADAAEAEAQQSEGGGEAPPDIQQFFPPVQINPTSPTPGMGPGMGELLEMGGSANQIANRAVAPARQQAGTLPSAAPPQYAQGGGQPGMSVNVGGQQYTAPDTITNTRETTAPYRLGPGLAIPYTTRTVETRQNALTAGDILGAHQNQVQFDEQMRTAAANFKVQTDMRSREAAVGMANDLVRSTGAPLDVAYRAAGAYLSGQDETAAKMLAGYDTSGRAQIAAERARAGYYQAKASEAEAAAKLSPLTMYNPSVMLGLPPDPTPLQPKQTADILASVQDDLSKVYGQPGYMAQGVSTQEKATRLDNIGLRMSKLGQIMAFPQVKGEGFWGSEKGAAQPIPATTAFLMLDIALAPDYPDAKRQAAAQRTAEAYGMGSMAELKDANGKKQKVFVSTVKDAANQPWVDRVHRAVDSHTDETMQQMEELYGAEVDKFIGYAGP